MKILLTHLIIQLVSININSRISGNYAEVDVGRYNVNDGEEPHIGINEFKNENKLCFFSYCWNRHANCAGLYCCRCECKNYGTFFSQKLGCFTGTQIKRIIQNDQDECQFYTVKHKFNYVPLFKTASKVKDIKLGLSLQEKSFSLNTNSTCYAGMIHYVDYSGKLKLLYNNKCEEKIMLYKDAQGLLNLKWNSRNPDDWKKLGGLLIKMDIHCPQTTIKTYKSCIIFQVYGELDKDVSISTPVPSNRTCPKIISTTQPIITTRTTQPITTNTTTIANKTKTSTFQVTTTTTTTTTNKTTITTSNPKQTTVDPLNRTHENKINLVGVKPFTTKDVNITGIVAGILTVIIVLLLACIIFVTFSRKHQKQKENTDATNNGILLDEQPTRPPAPRNQYEDQRFLYESPTDIGKDPEYYDEKACLYVAVNEEEPPQYSCIRGEPEYEPPNSAMSTLKRSSYDMSKRPLPKRPTEVNNPYYDASEVAFLPGTEDHCAENNVLYSIYSSIDNLTTM